MIDMREAYAGRTVLVTGHTGFKGSWLSAWLLQMGARVVGLALPPEPGRPSLFEVAGLERRMTSVLGDVRDAALVREVVERHEPEMVFHLAAQALVRPSYRSPVETYATNVMGTVHVLEAARAVPSVRAVVNVTSDKCYENREWVWGYRENEPMGGRDPYSSSKGCAELVTAAYRHSFYTEPRSAALASVRAGNVIGGGDWSEDRLVPDIVRALVRGEPVVIRNPGAVRPWQHVLEPVGGYLLLGARLLAEGARFASAWNFGPSEQDAVSVQELAERMLRRWGSGSISLEPAGDGLHEAHFLKLDCSKARQELGWRPRLGLDDALALTVEWYRGQQEQPGAAARLLDAQIEAYAARAVT